MGGCYSDSSSSRSSSSSYSSGESYFREFFRTKDRANLFNAYRVGGSKGFIRRVFDAAGIKAAVDEFPEFEIESKLDLRLIRTNEGKVPSIVEVTAFFDFPDTGRFLADSAMIRSSGVNNFYSADGGEIVLIEKGGKTYLKHKGPIQPYDLGVKGEEFVLKRRESREEKSLVEITEEFLHRSSRTTRYNGSLKKDKAETFVINADSGRVYSLVTSCVNDLASERFQSQLEVEYAGIVPQFGAAQDEPAIVSDILHIVRYLIFEYGGRNINPSYKLKLEPTTETKHEFVGKKLKALPPGNKGNGLKQEILGGKGSKAPLLEY